MKTLQKIFLALALALAFNLRAATNDAAIFSGTVVNPQGNPVAGATVVCYQYPSRQGFGPINPEAKQQVTTDSQGAFELSTFNGAGIVLATKPGFAPGWQSWNTAPEEPQKIALGKPSTLAGTVVDQAGQPVADAEVWVSVAFNQNATAYGQLNLVYGNFTRSLYSTRTSADGRFRIENFPADAQASLSVKKTGLAQHQSATPLRVNDLPFHAGQEDITLMLEPAGSVSGRVVARETGRPIASALVGLEPVTPGLGSLMFDQGQIATAADGSFQIPDVSAGSYQVMAEFTNQPIPDWVANPVPIKIAAGQTVSDVQIQADKGGVAEVTVRWKDSQQPIADASVSVNSADFNRGGATGTNGVADFRLLAGQYSVFATKQNWSQTQIQATVTEGQTTAVTVELATPPTVSGFVRDTTGAPLAGVRVGVFPNYWGGDPGKMTGADGHYKLHWQWVGRNDQTYFLVARDPERKLAAFHEIDESTTNLDVTVEPAMDVSGTVRDAKGKAVTNAMAYIMLHLENSSFGISGRPVYSDEQGRIQEEALPRGQRYGWYVSARGYGTSQEQMDTADPKADHYDFSPLVLKLADRQLAGRVLGTNGAPAAGVQVWMNGEGQPQGNAMTDDNGRFVFDAVCEGAVTVYANLNDASGSADAMGGDTNVVIRFDARNQVYMAASPQTLTGDVTDSSGNPAVGASVVVTPSWGAMSAAKTDAKGEFSVNWQSQPGGMRDVKYFAVARDVEKNLAAIEPIATNQTRVSLRLVPGLTISGTVQDGKGAPLPHANLNLNIMAGNRGGMVEYGRIKLNSDGTFTIPALPMEQQYWVFATANGYGTARKTIGKNQTRTNQIQLAPFKLKPANLPLAGRVLGTDNKPMAGAQVNLNGNGQPNGFTRSDENGHFSFKVCDGQVEVYAYSPSGGGRNNYGIAYARGGDTNVVVKMGAQPQRPVIREIPLKPQPWTFGALIAWPANHKTAAIILLSLQAVVLLGTGGGVFWSARKRGQRPG